MVTGPYAMNDAFANRANRQESSKRSFLEDLRALDIFGFFDVFDHPPTPPPSPMYSPPARASASSTDYPVSKPAGEPPTTGRYDSMFPPSLEELRRNEAEFRNAPDIPGWAKIWGLGGRVQYVVDWDAMQAHAKIYGPHSAKPRKPRASIPVTSVPISLGELAWEQDKLRDSRRQFYGGREPTLEDLRAAWVTVNDAKGRVEYAPDWEALKARKETPWKPKEPQKFSPPVLPRSLGELAWEQDKLRDSRRQFYGGREPTLEDLRAAWVTVNEYRFPKPR